jgi:hypothetical protein
LDWHHDPPANTIKNYEKHYKGLRYFFALIGDWESMLILTPDAPNGCPSMKVRSIILYFEWRRRTGILKDQNGQVVLDRFGEEIVCMGTWRDPGNVHQCRSAITFAHEKLDILELTMKNAPTV